MLLTAFCLIAVSLSGQTRILFDNTHAQVAGSASWTITTGYSDFAGELSKAGFEVNALNQGPINLDTLNEFDILVIPEPNRPFSADEISAIKTYTHEGHGLFLICDHNGSDRDGDGWDSIRIYTVFVSDFGFSFDKRTMSEHPLTNKLNHCSVMSGVEHVGSWGATSISILKPASVTGLICFSAKYGGNPLIVVSKYGQGRIAAIGDSSPFDDGSKNSSKSRTLYDNYNMPDYDHHQMSVNLVKWCAGQLGEDLQLTPIP